MAQDQGVRMKGLHSKCDTRKVRPSALVGETHPKET